MTATPTQPPSSTASTDGPPPTDLPARSETREVTFSVPVPQHDGWEVECTMRLMQRGKDEWTIGIPPALTSIPGMQQGLPPNVYVTGRAAAETLTRALAVAYALHCSEATRSSTRYAMYVAHYLTEARIDPVKAGITL